jgi:hypothetical protein
MNQKKAYRSDEAAPEYLYSVDVDVEVRGKITGHRLTRNTVLSVSRGINRPAGQYVFQYGELVNGTLVLYVDRYGTRKLIRVDDITKVHLH